MKCLRSIQSELHLIGIFLISTLVFGGTQASFSQNAKLDLKNLDKLTSKASEVNDVTLDENMLKIASNSLGSDGVRDSHPEKAAKIDKASKLIGNLKGVYVKDFSFAKENEYSFEEDVEPIRTQLNSSGWSRLVMSKNSKNGGELDEVYVMKDPKDGDKSLGMAILVAEPKELTVVNIVGALDLSQMGQLGQLGKLGKLGKMTEHAGASNETSPNKTDNTDKNGTESK